MLEESATDLQAIADLEYLVDLLVGQSRLRYEACSCMTFAMLPNRLPTFDAGIVQINTGTPKAGNGSCRLVDSRRVKPLNAETVRLGG